MPGRALARQRIILWHDADVLLRAKPVLFAKVAEAIFGVSGELEFSGEGGVFVQRCVFLGSESLKDAATAPASAFRRWHDADGSGFWPLVTGLKQPPVSVCSVERLLGDLGRSGRHQALA